MACWKELETDTDFPVRTYAGKLEQKDSYWKSWTTIKFINQIEVFWEIYPFIADGFPY